MKILTSDDLINKFSVALIFLARLFSLLSDPFYLKRLYLKNQKLIKFFVREEGDLIKSLDDMLELIDEIAYLKLCESYSVLQAKKYVLEFKSGVLKINRGEQKKVIEEPQKAKKEKITFKPDSNKGQIFSFIKQKKVVRIKEVVDNFSDMAKRTILRNLKELTDAGFLHRENGNKGVYHSLN